MYVLDFLRSRGVQFEALLHQPAASSTKRAKSLHVPGGKVAKTVLVKAGESYVLAVLPSTSRIDLNQLCAAVAKPDSGARLATSDELFKVFTDCEPGVVPPFGRLYGLTTVIDSSLAQVPEIVFGANTRHEGLRMHFDDYLALEAPVQASFSRPIAAGGSASPTRGECGRRAG
jgi:Ala-tRNA(Pro) deacylase